MTAANERLEMVSGLDGLEMVMENETASVEGSCGKGMGLVLVFWLGRTEELCWVVRRQ